jgi:hypothetical protein
VFVLLYFSIYFTIDRFLLELLSRPISSYCSVQKGKRCVEHCFQIPGPIIPGATA